jgi:hypothetical protein
MVRCLVLACGLSLLPGTAPAQDRILWIGESPCLIPIHEVDKATGSLVFRQMENNFVLAEREVTQQTIDGKTRTKQVPYYRTAQRPNKVAFSLKQTRVYDTTGTRLTEADVLERARPGMLVVIARLGDELPLTYLFILKKETLILLLPSDHEVPTPEPRPMWSLLDRLLDALEDAEDQRLLRCERMMFGFKK